MKCIVPVDGRMNERMSQTEMLDVEPSRKMIKDVILAMPIFARFSEGMVGTVFVHVSAMTVVSNTIFMHTPMISIRVCGPSQLSTKH